MPTPTDTERLVALERDVKHVCSTVEAMDKKLDTVIEGKADKREVDDLKKLVISILLAVAGFSITTLVGLTIWIVQASANIGG